MSMFALAGASPLFVRRYSHLAERVADLVEIYFSLIFVLKIFRFVRRGARERGARRIVREVSQRAGRNLR